MDAVGTRTVGNIVINAHWKRIRFLEYHTNPFSQKIDVHVSVNILTV